MFGVTGGVDVDGDDDGAASNAAVAAIVVMDVVDVVVAVVVVGACVVVFMVVLVLLSARLMCGCELVRSRGCCLLTGRGLANGGRVLVDVAGAT